jgi:hypothetical protein
MKKTTIYLIVFTIIFCIFNSSCLTLLDNASNQSTTRTSSFSKNINANWAIGMIKNEWGENTGNFYSHSRNNITGSLTRDDVTQGTRRIVTTEQISIRSLIFSNSEGLSFHIHGVFIVESRDCDIIIRQNNGEERRFAGFYYFTPLPNRNNKIEIEYSDDLREALLLENIEIRISLNGGRNSEFNYRYQFGFPNGFNEAYTSMISEENSFIFDEKNIRLHWSLGQYVNEWGDGLGQYFTQYDGTLKSWLLVTGSTYNRKEIFYIKDLTFSEAEGLFFPIDESLLIRFTPELNVTIKQANGNVNTFNARYLRTTGKILIPYSESLRNILLQGNVELNFEINSTFKYNVIFKFPSQFSLALEKLRERESGN